MNEAESLLPLAVQRSTSYIKEVEAIRKKNPAVIVVPGLESLADHLRYHTWDTKDVLNVFPWKLSFFLRRTSDSLPFILNTTTVRKAFPEKFAAWDYEHRNARKLYDPKDVHDWFSNHLLSKIETVLVPLPLFATRPDAMRESFRVVKDDKLSSLYQAKHAKVARQGRLALWPEIKQHIRPEFRNEVGRFFDDLLEAAKKQNVGVHRAHLKKYPVRLPADKLPYFIEKQSIGKTRGYDSVEVSITTARCFAWAEHTFIEDPDPNAGRTKHAFTQGLWIGGDYYRQDYESGLLELMTAERFVKLFGASALDKADWRLTPEMCAWYEKDAKFGPGFPPKVLSVLLGINYRAPKER